MTFTLDMLDEVRVIVCHENSEGSPCPDGMASAILLNDALPDREVRFVSYGTSLAKLPVQEGILFCDIAPEADRAAEFVAAGALVLDHHESRRDVVRSFGERGVFGENAELGSGAMLAFTQVWSPKALDRRNPQGFFGSKPRIQIYHREREPRASRFAHLAAVRDTWHPDHEDWQAACEQAAALAFWDWPTFSEARDPFGPNAYSRVEDFGGRALAELMAVGPHLVKKRREHVARLASECSGKLCQTVAGYSFLAVNVFTSADTSDLSELLKEQVDIVAGYRVTPSGKLLVSLRSRSGIDVSRIAAYYEGGGHPGAAGFSMSLTGHPETVIRDAIQEALLIMEQGKP